MTRSPYDRLSRIVATVLSTAPFLCAGAHAEPVAGFNLGGSVEYATNPFLLIDTDTASSRAQVSASTFIQNETARSSLRVNADASFSKYERRYPNSVDLSTQVAYQSRLTRQLSVRGGMSLNSSIGSGYGTAPLFVAPDPVPGILPPVIDITAVGVQERSTQAQGRAGLTYAIDGKNAINLDYDASVIRYPKTLRRAEFASFAQTVGYSRTINARISGGASVTIGKTNYFGGRVNDAVTISPSLNGSVRLAAPWTLNAGIGVTSSRINLPIGRLTSTNLSGNFGLCRNDPRARLCLTASRSTSATSFDGLRTTTSLGASYSYELSPRDTFTASGGYSRSGSAVRSPGTGSIDYISGSASISRRLSGQLSGSIAGGFSRSGFLGIRSNAYGSIGINYSFNGRR